MDISRIATRSGTAGEVNQAKRATIAGFVGTALEYYDLYIYASAAALVFGTVFFPDAGKKGIFIAFSTYGVAYLARPLGGIIAGHFSDKFGRRGVLLAILMIMGAATFAIGCLPAYERIGIWAPIILVVLRIAQGLSAGGELSSSSSLTTEHAPPRHRGLYTAISAMGAMFGYLLATLAFLGVASLPREDMLAWGWRLPFLASVVLVFVGLMVRWWLREPEVFLRQQTRAAAAHRFPLVEVLREQPADFLRVVLSSLQIVVSVIVPVYGLTYATSVAGLSSQAMLTVVAAGYFAALGFFPLGGHLSDRFGRKPLLIIANVVAATFVWLFFYAVSIRSFPLIYVGMFTTFSVGWGVINGIYPIFYAELFRTRFRVTGVAVGLQIGLILTGFSPLLAQALSTLYGDAWWPVALVSSLCSIIAIVTIATTRETYRSALTASD